MRQNLFYESAQFNWRKQWGRRDKEEKQRRKLSLFPTRLFLTILKLFQSQDRDLTRGGGRGGVNIIIHYCISLFIWHRLHICQPGIPPLTPTQNRVLLHVIQNMIPFTILCCKTSSQTLELDILRICFWPGVADVGRAIKTSFYSPF